MALDDEIHKVFFDEARDLIARAEEETIALGTKGYTKERIEEIFRSVHSFKGAARTLGFEELASFVHKLENILARVQDDELDVSASLCQIMLQSLDTMSLFVEGLQHNPRFFLDTSDVEAEIARISSGTRQRQSRGDAASAAAGLAPLHHGGEPAPDRKEPTSDSLRVPLTKLDSLLDVVGELVVNFNMLWDHKSKGTLGGEESLRSLSYMASIVKEIQDVAMSLRMVSIKPLLQKLQRAVVDTAAQLEKKAAFVTAGDHVELEKTILERMTDPLIHIVRNAMDHGIEDEATRRERSKNPIATVRFEIQQKEDQVEISVADDGFGIDTHRVLTRAIEKGLVTQDEAKNLTAQQITSLLFLPGFSTKGKVTEISGRGVGLDVVKRVVDDLKGTLHVDSRLGLGTRFIVTLPQSFAIIAGMVVDIDGLKYIIPISQLVETLEFRHFKMETVLGQGHAINLRGQTIPVLSLSELLHGKTDTGWFGQRHQPGLIISHEGRRISFTVNEILGQQHVVLKKLGYEMRGIRGVTAGAILANGDPGIVLDLNEIVQRSLHDRRPAVA